MSPQPSPQFQAFRRWLHSNWLLVFLLAVCIARLWLMPLASSFWTDETETALIVQHPSDPSLAAAPQLTSIYYTFPRAAGKLFGYSEISYRIPSVLLMGIAIFLIGRLAARLIDPGAGWFAVFACLALANFDYFAADARPYPLGICVSVACLYFLVEWLDTGQWKPAFLFLLFGAMLWWVQPIFWAFYPVFFIYTLVRLLRSDTKAGWIGTLLVYLLLALALMPSAWRALSLLPDAKSHIFAAIPGLWSLSRIPWEPIALCAGGAWLAGMFLKWPFRKPASLSALALICAWWLWMPLCLFAYSRVTGMAIFVPRYFSLALPGAAMAATAATALFLPATRWKQAAAVLAIAGLIAVGRWTVLWPDHTPENWRQASLDADLSTEKPDTPVLAISPFVEARPPVWSPEYHVPGFLYAPLFVYPLRGRIYPFPFEVSPDTERYASKLLSDTLLKRSQFIIYGAGRNAESWALWYAKRPELASWHSSVSAAGVVETFVFENAAAR